MTKLPRFDVPSPYTSWEYLNKLCYEGLDERYGDRAEELKPRLKYELDTIQKMGYVDYFLIVWDFIRYARDHGIPVGPGRGSAAGSIVSYTLGITQLDPIRYNLLFERFLNPERVSMPDIDVDFCFERRQEVIDYVVRKYGKDCVAQIVTFGTMAARGVIRDVGRVMDLPYAASVIRLRRMIPQELNITIDKALEHESGAESAMYDTDETGAKSSSICPNVWRACRAIRPCMRLVSSSARRQVDEYVPLVQSGGWHDRDTVYDDDPGGAWPFEDGFSGASDTDGH